MSLDCFLLQLQHFVVSVWLLHFPCIIYCFFTSTHHKCTKRFFLVADHRLIHQRTLLSIQLRRIRSAARWTVCCGHHEVLLVIPPDLHIAINCICKRL